MITIIPTPKVCNEKEGKMLTLIPAIYTNHKDFEDLAKTFAEDYNATLDSVGKIESPALQQKAGWLIQNTKSYAKDLEKVGITADENGRLTVNEETLRKADIETLSGLFEGATSYGGKTAVKANHVQAYAQFQATNAASAYNNNGAIYNSQTSLNTGNLFDSLF